MKLSGFPVSLSAFTFIDLKYLPPQSTYPVALANAHSPDSPFIIPSAPIGGRDTNGIPFVSKICGQPKCSALAVTCFVHSSLCGVAAGGG